MARGKMQNEAEVRRWLAEGKTYDWMQDEYRRKYKLDVSKSMFSNFRARHGIERRISRDDELIPWEVRVEHRWAYPLAMLRVEGRRRAGFDLRASDAERLEAWKRRMHEDGLVVHYEPRTEQGFWLVPRRPGIDNDLIREPDRRTTRRGNADNRE